MLPRVVVMLSRVVVMLPPRSLCASLRYRHMASRRCVLSAVGSIRTVACLPFSVYGPVRMLRTLVSCDSRLVIGQSATPSQSTIQRLLLPR